MVASHFGFYCAEVLKIKDAVTGDTVPMLVNKAQTYLQAQAEAQIEEMGMVGLMVLKGRQVGCTQWVAARYFRKVSLSRGRRVYVLAHGRRHSASAGASSTTGSPSTAPLTTYRGSHQNPRQVSSDGRGAMQVVRVKHVKSYRRRGRVFWYHRLTKERLPDDEAKRIARVLEINATLDDRRDDVIPGSLGDLICCYKAAPEFTRLAASTRETYLRYLDLIERAVADTTVADIDAAWLYQARDGVADTPRSADILLSIFSVLLNFAVARGWRPDNPAQHVKKLRGGKSYEPWPAVAIERFRAGANPCLVWAMELAIFTGQRRADVLAMQWRHIEGGMISVAQQKTGQRLLIPIHEELATVLKDIPRVGMNIVHRQDGRAYTGSGFASIFQREKRRLGLGGLQFHGLRHTAAAQLAEAGATDREIMAILGHRTTAMVTRYTRGAEQERLARAAIVKLESRTKVSNTPKSTV